jgi:hypothetical protein
MLNSLASSFAFYIPRRLTSLPIRCQGSVFSLRSAQRLANRNHDIQLQNGSAFQLTDFPLHSFREKIKKSDFNSASSRCIRGNRSLVLPGVSCFIPHYSSPVSRFLFFIYRPSPHPLHLFSSIIRFFAFPKKVHKNTLSPAFHGLSLLCLVIRSSIRF